MSEFKTDPMLEKGEDAHVEDKAASSDLSLDEEFTPAQGRKIIHRVDRRLVTMTGFMYCISLMDRTNLSNAAIAGMTKELKLTIFIIEGVITCLIAIVGYFLLIDFPEKASNSWNFLSDREINFIIRRVNKDRGDAELLPFTYGRFLRPALDLKIWGFAMLFFCSTTVAYAIAYFLPIILEEGMGFSVGAAQCLVAPPYAFAGIVMFSTAWIGDKYHIRGPIVVFNAILGLIGLPRESTVQPKHE
ncbi:MAG: hypothetical protein Q9227_007662 [Pyrenula ochraceoflavens]